MTRCLAAGLPALLILSIFGTPAVSAQVVTLPVIKVFGALSQNATWVSGNVYLVTSDVTVPIGITLAIQPGAIVKFNAGASLSVQGVMYAVGTTTQPVFFTSARDDSVGGDSNGHGTATTPAVRDWGNLQFGDPSFSFIDFATVRYSGQCRAGS